MISDIMCGIDRFHTERAALLDSVWVAARSTSLFFRSLTPTGMKFLPVVLSVTSLVFKLILYHCLSGSIALALFVFVQERLFSLLSIFKTSCLNHLRIENRELLNAGKICMEEQSEI